MGQFLLEEHEGLGGNVFDNVVGLLVDEVLLEHVNLVVPKHATLGNLAQSLDLGRKALVLINFFHETSVLLRLGGVDGLRPASLLVEHSLLPCADSVGVDLVDGEVGDVVEFDEVGVSEDVVFAFEVVLGRGVKGSADGRSVCELGRSAELAPGPRVLEKFSHIFITYSTKSFEFTKYSNPNRLPTIAYSVPLLHTQSSIAYSNNISK